MVARLLVAIMKQYEYEKLSSGQIRLLRLHPAEGSSVLEANLSIFYIQSTQAVPKIVVKEAGEYVEPERSNKTDKVEPEDSNKSPEKDREASRPAYKALSYTWGLEPERSSIKILANNEAYSINIKPNLESALRQLRSQTSYQYFWVDALCINQKDSDEKGFQIPMMSDIYHKAEEVCIWLGPEGGDSNMAMDFIQDCLRLDDVDQLGRLPRHSKSWAALLTLMRRPWFNRRWIVQELVRARKATVYCGERKENWQEFADAVSMFAFKQDDIRLSFKESSWYNHHPDYIGDIDELGATKLVFAWDNFFRKSENGNIIEPLHSLEALMSFLTVFEAKDPKDTLYAILWLAKDAKPVSKRTRAWKDYFGFTETPPSTPFLPTHPEGRVTDFSGHLSPTSQQQELSLVTEGISNQDFGYFPQNAPTESNHSVPIPRRSSSSGSSRYKVPLSAMNEAEKKAGAKQLFIQGLINADDKKIFVDYEKTLFEVCKDFLRLVFKQSSSLDMLLRPWAPDPPEGEPPLPSWIASRRNSPFGISINRVYRRINADPLVGMPGMDQRVYNAHKTFQESKPTISEGKDRSLEVTGFVLDVVKEKKPHASEGVIPSEWLDAVRWKNITTELPPDSFWRTIVANRDAHGKRPPFLWKRVCQDAFNRRPRGGDLNTRELLDYDCPSAIRGFLQRVQRVVWKRRLAFLEHNISPDHLALVPSTTKKGDKICILHGCSVPVVLRQFANGEPVAKYYKERRSDLHTLPNGDASIPNGEASNSNGDVPGPLPGEIHYELIGECYVHGFMDGEAVGKPHKVESFSIR